MDVLEQTASRLHLRFRDEPAAQLLLVYLAEPTTPNGLYLLFTVVISAYAFLDRTAHRCQVDLALGRFTIVQVNGLGLSHRITCRISDIRAIEVRRRVSGRGRPCSAVVILNTGRQVRLLSYQSCAEQRQIVDRLVSFAGLKAGT